MASAAYRWPLVRLRRRRHDEPGNGRFAVRLILSAVVVAAVCAGTAEARPKPPAPPPTVIAKPGLPAPARARFYADCIAAAATAGSFERDPDGDLIRFNCSGEPARRFYDGLAAWTAKIGSEISAPDAEGAPRVWRFTQKLNQNPFGVDYCSADAAGGDHRCVVVLNVGEFLSAQ